jgi:hypothetical protein
MTLTIRRPRHGLALYEPLSHGRGWEKTSDHAPVWIELADKPKRKFGPKPKPVPVRPVS